MKLALLQYLLLALVATPTMLLAVRVWNFARLYFRIGKLRENFEGGQGGPLECVSDDMLRESMGRWSPPRGWPSVERLSGFPSVRKLAYLRLAQDEASLRRISLHFTDLGASAVLGAIVAWFASGYKFESKEVEGLAIFVEIPWVYFFLIILLNALMVVRVFGMRAVHYERLVRIYASHIDEASEV